MMQYSAVRTVQYSAVQRSAIQAGATENAGRAERGGGGAVAGPSASWSCGCTELGGREG